MLSVQRNVHQLLCNTLPAPIVAEVASGHVEVAHRYEQVAMHMHMHMPCTQHSHTMHVSRHAPCHAPCTHCVCHAHR